MASSRSGIWILLVFGLVAVAVSSSDAGCEPNTEAGDDFDFGEGDEGLPTCDGVVAVESPSGSVQVPADTELFGSSESADCTLGDDGGDEEAVVALQIALVRCNDENVTVDGDYGAQTTQAVTRVQEGGDVEADGTFDPDTRQAMTWPTTSAEVTCVAGDSLGAPDDAS